MPDQKKKNLNLMDITVRVYGDRALIRLDIIKFNLKKNTAE